MSILNGLYTITQQNTQELTIQLANENHPIFKAHFPEHPILPGFALIDIMAECLNDTIVGINQSKFIANALPNDILLCNIENNQKQKKIKIFRDKEKISEIRYESK